MTFDPVEILKIITETQRRCIAMLSEEWKSTGYGKVDADILYALGGSDLYGGYGPVVDCDYLQKPDRCPDYRHKLLPLGLQLKQLIMNS